MTTPTESTARPTIDSRALDRLARGLERIVPWAARAIRPVSTLCLAGAVAGSLLWAMALSAGDNDNVVDWLALALLLALLLAPAAVLLLFVTFLRQLLRLPDQLRGLPETTRAHGGQLVGLLGDLRRPRDGDRRGILGSIRRLGGLLIETGGLIEPFTALAAFAKLPYLILVLIAALAVGVEITVCLLIVLVRTAP